ncbi:uncharacterized protein LOC143038590 [Oratosquilla oratoria]|uniref:uncharacterized protein LOC143038590 n=1 Tax=Oratosquilla oratoria TaxID=337810 RepID=UPI003F76A2AC
MSSGCVASPKAPEEGDDGPPSFTRTNRRLREKVAGYLTAFARAQKKEKEEEEEVETSFLKEGLKEELDPETYRLVEDQTRERNWKRWGPYLSERQWGTVREDYSPDGDCWSYFPHDHARSRAYRWGEDGLGGVCDRQGRLCTALALWNARDPILKERLYGLTGPEGNHGEDVKECYYYMDSTPTHSHMRFLYKYPVRFPYQEIVEGNASRTISDPEFEIEDTGAFEVGYWDVEMTYAKGDPNDLLLQVDVTNRSTVTETLHVLPTLWYRNTWSWGCSHEGCSMKPKLVVDEGGGGGGGGSTSYRLVRGNHDTLGTFLWAAEAPEGTDDGAVKGPEILFTENETNTKRLFGVEANTPFVKDAFHRYVVNGEKDAVNPKLKGTKVAAHYVVTLGPGSSASFRTRLWEETPGGRGPGGGALGDGVFGPAFAEVMAQRRAEADWFYEKKLSPRLTAEERQVFRQALAGLLWTKQFYHYSVRDWLSGDADQPQPPDSRLRGRNADWPHLFNRDVISMPDKWEYPWYASWDLAFHVVAMALVDEDLAKQQLLLFLREWYMHPNGQIPAYEFALGDVNPPVHAWAVVTVFRGTGVQDERDREFLARSFVKLTTNHTWWVNRKDPDGNNLYGGGFLGLDNIGVFDRSKTLPFEGTLEQADGTAWMSFYCSSLLDMALTLAEFDPSSGAMWEDMASKYLEHFVYILDAINALGQGQGLWHEEDGFYYDHVRMKDGRCFPIKVRSLVGLVPMFAVLVLNRGEMRHLKGFYKRTTWFIENRPDLFAQVTFETGEDESSDSMLLAVPSKDNLLRLLKYVLDEDEFLSPFGIRSLSKAHQAQPVALEVDGQRFEVSYVPGESNTHLFGGNSNWRGPVWFPMNFLLIQALKRYHYFYKDNLKVECPTGSGCYMNLHQVATEIARRLVTLFLPGPDGGRPCHGDNPRYKEDPAWRDLILFYEFFDGDSGRGCGASHQTGWTALVANLLNVALGHPQAGLATHKEPKASLECD